MSQPSFNLSLATTTTPTTLGFGLRSRLTMRLRRKGVSIRLGGPRQRRVTRYLKALKMKWLRLKQAFMLRKLRQYYRKLIRELIDSAASADAFQRRLVAEASFAVPVMGISFSSYPSHSVY
ncbi:hypothetical protein QQ045_019485 [Rhodiola kirilowii]